MQAYLRDSHATYATFLHYTRKDSSQLKQCFSAQCDAGCTQCNAAWSQPVTCKSYSGLSVTDVCICSLGADA